MITGLFKKVFGSRNDRLVKSLLKSVARINALESKIMRLSDAALTAKTHEFRERFKAGTTLDDLLPEAYAVVREASRRTLGLRHFDVQMVGGMVLHQGKIAEMRTGEGKTLVATLAVYLNALPGKGVHVVTVNDYLARRDAIWMGKIYHQLGLSIGVINSAGGLGPDATSYLYDPDYDPADLADASDLESSGRGYRMLRPITRRETYAADITYGTNNEYGFDYLRDNMVFVAENRVQRDPWYAIVDEVDSILIDEARTPLIISGPSEGGTELYKQINLLIPKLKRQPPIINEEGQPDFGPGDYSVDEKLRQVFLSEEGHEHIESMLVATGLLTAGDDLYDPANIVLMHHVYAALRAHALFNRNVEYLVRDGQVIIVDEFTGRTLPGRRWSDGLHQAVEAKEEVTIQPENQTLASITFQNLFRLYPKLAGMTGTADTEAYEFQQIYNLEVVVIPTNQPMIREDRGDQVYLTQEEKYQAIVEDITDCVARKQPVLVGTVSIEISELVANRLKDADIPHAVLNAKHHESEAGIVAQAGRPGAVTIATNMAGRGTDIVLGGNLVAELAESDPNADHEAIRAAWQERHNQVIAVGGLHVVGTERHESRRVDNQLRGRSGRQGDPGSSRFYLSLEDNLMRIFASDRVSKIMQRLGMEPGEAIEHPWVTKSIANAQRKVEGRNFDIRKQLLEYDDVANDQRQVIYRQRRELMDSEDISATVAAMQADVFNTFINSYIPPESLEEQWDIPGLTDFLMQKFGGVWPLQTWLDSDDNLHEETLRAKIHEEFKRRYQEKENLIGIHLRRVEKATMLQVLDRHWKDHLAAMDYLRQGIHLRGYAQRNPKQEYKREAFLMFSNMLEEIKQEVVTALINFEIHFTGPPSTQNTKTPPAPPPLFSQQAEAVLPHSFEFSHKVFAGFNEPHTPEAQSAPREHHNVHAPYVRGGRKVGRNEPCPCGSEKKYKHCHGKV